MSELVAHVGKQPFDYPEKSTLMYQFTHLTEQEIMDGLAEVLKSPHDFGVLRSIVIRPGHEERLRLRVINWWHASDESSNNE